MKLFLQRLFIRVCVYLDFLYGVLIWLTPIGVYCYSWYLSIKYFLMPLIEIYGLWNWVGMLLGITAMAAVSSFAFFWLISNSKSPQATYRESRDA